MVKENIKKHDQLSFEANLRFPSNDKSGGSSVFNVNMFLFLPRGLDINKHNYTKKDFYNSLKTSIRLTAPFFRLENMMDGNKNPFHKLQTKIRGFLSHPNNKTKIEYEKEIKRFCSIFNVALEHQARKITRTHNTEKQLLIIDSYETDILNIRKQFHSLRGNFINLSDYQDTFEIFKYADEYQSLLIEKHTASIIKRLTKDNHNNNIKSLSNIVVVEMDYRSEMAYPSVATTNKPTTHLLHRIARLKKFIESNLYLNTYTKKEGVVVEQLLFSFAAGIAMIFATGIAFATQLLYGNLSLSFFIALVIAYMFKDRIKELIRIYLSKKHQKVFYDFKTKIYYHEKKTIGNLKESFNFEQYSHLPVEILKIRNSIRATEITEESLGENIIHYRTKVKIRNKIKHSNDFSGVTQILRFNISDFIRKMDDPEKEILLRTKDGFKRAFSDRVYHINLIMTYTENNEYKIKPYKIYANRKGISRIEKIINYK